MFITGNTIREEVFTFTPADGTPEINLLSGQLRSFLLTTLSDRTMDLTFPQQTTEELIAQHGLEPARMASMTEQEAQEPVIVGLWRDGTHTLIDGAHRRWFWASRGVSVLQGWVVPEVVWRAFEFDPNHPSIVANFEDGTLLPQRLKK